MLKALHGSSSMRVLELSAHGEPSPQRTPVKTPFNAMFCSAHCNLETQTCVLQVGVLALDALLRALPSLSVFLRSAPFMGHGGLMHATSMNLEVRRAPCPQKAEEAPLRV
jgi:hypothetical protein